MSGLEILVSFASATAGGGVGAMVPHLIKWLRDWLHARKATSVSQASYSLDPRLNQYVQRASTDWAVQRGHPEVSPLAAGYIGDAAQEFQRRRGGLR